MSETLVGGRLATVVVRRSAVEAADDPERAQGVTQAIVDYVNGVMRAGHYARHELPAKATQAYHADYYLAQVNNGGHSQFIHNCGKQFPTTVADALAGLEAMGAQAQHRILTEMAAWVAANPAEAAAQSGCDFSVARRRSLCLPELLRAGARNRQPVYRSCDVDRG